MECRLLCEASRGWPGSIPHNTTNFGWAPATHHSSQLVLHICCISTPTLPVLGAEGRRVRFSLMPSCPFPGAGHAAWAALGHRALPCEKQPVPGSAPQIFHSVPHARVVNTLWEAARAALSSLLSSHGGTLKLTLTFFLFAFCNPVEFC